MAFSNALYYKVIKIPVLFYRWRARFI